MGYKNEPVMDWKALVKPMVVGAATGTAVGLLAFGFLTFAQHPGMGTTLFVLSPIAAGFSIALVARSPHSTTAAALLSVVFSLVLLIVLGKEGGLCAVLALPIIVLAVFIGLGIGALANLLIVDRAKNQTTTMGMLLLLAPVLIVAGEKIETPFLLSPRTEVIQTQVEVHDSPERVWPNILSIDNIQASKPFLMYVGLPIPQRCELHGQGWVQSVPVISMSVSLRKRSPDGIRHTTWGFLSTGHICRDAIGSVLKGLNTGSNLAGA
jgi:hypothetical protein